MTHWRLTGNRVVLIARLVHCKYHHIFICVCPLCSVALSPFVFAPVSVGRVVLPLLVCLSLSLLLLLCSCLSYGLLESSRLSSRVVPYHVLVPRIKWKAFSSSYLCLSSVQFDGAHFISKFRVRNKNTCSIRFHLIHKRTSGSGKKGNGILIVRHESSRKATSFFGTEQRRRNEVEGVDGDPRVRQTGLEGRKGQSIECTSREIISATPRLDRGPKKGG